MRMKPWCREYPGGRPPRFLRPFLLLLLRGRPAHGYELLDRLRTMGLGYTEQDAGYIYKTLRAMEKAGLISSQWDTTGYGPAKRVYVLTAQGKAELAEWARALEHIKDSLEAFLQLYRGSRKKGSEHGLE